MASCVAVATLQDILAILGLTSAATVVLSFAKPSFISPIFRAIPSISDSFRCTLTQAPSFLSHISINIRKTITISSPLYLVAYCRGVVSCTGVHHGLRFFHEPSLLFLSLLWACCVLAELVLHAVLTPSLVSDRLFY